MVVHILCYPNIATVSIAKTSKSAKELFEQYHKGFLEYLDLPMKKEAFLEVLKGKELLSDELRGSLEQMDKTIDRSSYFLDNIIKAGFDSGDESPFINLLNVMIESSYNDAKDFATMILEELGTSQNYNAL